MTKNTAKNKYSKSAMKNTSSGLKGQEQTNPIINRLRLAAILKADSLAYGKEILDDILETR